MREESLQRWPRRRAAAVDTLSRVIRGDLDLPLDQFGTAELAALAGLADREQVLLTVADRLRVVGDMPPPWAQRADERSRHRALLLQERSRIHDALGARDVDHAFIKGATLQEIWPEGRERQYSDIDVVARHSRDWAAVAAAFESLGYEIEAASLVVDGGGTGVLYLTDRGARSAEVHFGTLTVNYWHPTLRLDDGFWHELDLSSGPPRPSRRWLAAVYVAELLERRRLTLRDRLDAAAVFDGLTAADLDWLTGLAADARLEAELRLAREAARPGIAGDRAPSGPGGLTGLTRRVAPSASRAVRHVLSATAGRHRPLALRAAAVSAVRDWAIDRLDEHPTSRLHAVPAAWLNDLLTPFVVGPGACAFMIPLNETDRGPFTLDRDGSQWIARTPVGSFLAAALPTVSPSRLEAARSASPVPSRNEQR